MVVTGGMAAEGPKEGGIQSIQAQVAEKQRLAEVAQAEDIDARETEAARLAAELD